MRREEKEWEKGGRRRERRGEDKVGKEKKEQVIPHIQPAVIPLGLKMSLARQFGARVDFHFFRPVLQ